MRGQWIVHSFLFWNSMTDAGPHAKGRFRCRDDTSRRIDSKLHKSAATGFGCSGVELDQKGCKVHKHRKWEPPSGFMFLLL